MPGYNDFEDELLKHFPEWADDFQSYFADYAQDEDIGNYIITGDFIIPKLKVLAAQQDVIAIEKTFAFFEQVSSWEPVCDELIHVEIGEWLALSSSKETEYLKQFAGPSVLFAIRTIEDWHKANQGSSNAD